MRKNMAVKVTYIAHSGFSVELEEHVLLFDYFTGRLPEWAPDKEVTVFASHKHRDHFNVHIFDLAERYEKIHYIFGSDIRLKEEWMHKNGLDPAILGRSLRMRAGENVCVAGVSVRALRSTDAGAAFIAETEGKRFYHAGDLNWWYWEEEDKARNRNMETDYKRQIDGIAGMHFDAAFVPLDPRLGETAYGLGMDYFLEKTDAARVFPMHMWEEYGWIDRYRQTQTGMKHAGQICRIRERGEEFRM